MMNSALLIALNAMALAVLVIFQFQPAANEDAVAAGYAVPHHMQQQLRPQLAVMTPNMQAPIQLAHGKQGAASSEHWIF